MTADAAPEPPTAGSPASLPAGPGHHAGGAVTDATRDIAEVSAGEVISTAAVHLMSAAAVKCGLAEDGPSGSGAQYLDLD